MDEMKPQQRGNDCLNCKHHTWKDGVACNHLSRPERPVTVVRWAAGCPQHVTKETA